VQLTRLQPKTAFTVCGGGSGVDGGAGFPGRSYSDRFTRLVRLLIPVFTALALMASTAAAPNVKNPPKFDVRTFRNENCCQVQKF